MIDGELLDLVGDYYDPLFAFCKGMLLLFGYPARLF